MEKKNYTLDDYLNLKLDVGFIDPDHKKLIVYSSKTKEAIIKTWHNGKNSYHQLTNYKPNLSEKFEPIRDIPYDKKILSFLNKQLNKKS